MTRKFIAIWRQSDGCDYTIGCGIAIHNFAAADMEAAKVHVIASLSDPDLNDDTAGSITQVDIIEAVDQPVTMMPGTWLAVRKGRAHERWSESEALERVEFERLKRKFGGG
jgi:hypothetical protein